MCLKYIVWEGFSEICVIINSREIPHLVSGFHLAHIASGKNIIPYVGNFNETLLYDDILFRRLIVMPRS